MAFNDKSIQFEFAAETLTLRGMQQETTLGSDLRFGRFSVVA
jgi:hypothetical protein